MALLVGCGVAPTSAVTGRALPAAVGPPPAIDAHDGSIVQHGGTYWLFGTSYDCGFALHRVGTRWCGISAFSSTDLLNWSAEGYAVPPTALWQQRCSPPRFGCFRPHVARSATTGQWVLWLNTYDTAEGYRVLVAGSPAGPWLETTAPTLAVGGKVLPSRGDQDVFVDWDGRGWIAYTVIEKGRPFDIVIERLNSDLTSGTGEFVRLPLGMVEAPALFERFGRYFLSYSDPACPYCPSGTGLMTAPSPLGPWVDAPALSDESCGGQPADVTQLRLADETIWLYQSDRWDRGNPNQARATTWWEPLTFRADGFPASPLCGQPPARFSTGPR